MNLQARKQIATQVMAFLLLSSGIGIIGAPAFAATAKTLHHVESKGEKVPHKQVGAVALLNALNKNSHNVRYSQASIHQTETITVAGQVKTIHVTEMLQTEHVGTNDMILGTISVSQPGSAMREQLFINHNKMYMKSGQAPWVLIGSINNTKLLQLTQTIDYMFKKVTVKHVKNSEVFQATLNPLTFSSMIKQDLSVFTPSTSAPAIPANMNKVMAIMFQHVRGSLSVTARKVQGVERVIHEDVTMAMSIPAAAMQAITRLAQSQQNTVTSSVYGQGNPVTPPIGAMKMSLMESVNFTYKNASIHVPAGIPAQ